MKVNCKNEGQLQSFKREQFAVRGTNVLCSSRAVHVRLGPRCAAKIVCTHAPLEFSNRLHLVEYARRSLPHDRFTRIWGRHSVVA